VRAVTYQDVRDFQVIDVPKPAVQNTTDVLLRVTLGAICGSDLHIYHGHTPINPGAVVGHEFVGVVEEVGSEVRRFKAGDRVVASFFTACGHCYLCRRGWYAQCENKGTFGHGEYFGDLGGGQAEYVVVPLADHTLELIPEGMSDDAAIFVGDIMSTAYFGAERAEIRPGDSVAVIGAGPVGLCAVMAAGLFGPARIFAVDSVPARLELAADLGAVPVDMTEVHPVEFLQSQTHGHGVDATIECVGHVSAVETAVHAVRGGGTISMVGVPSKTEWPFPLMHAWMKDLTFRAGWCNVQAYMRPLLDLIAAGRLHPDRIISHRMKLDDAAEAYRMFDARQATKIVLTP
jgi:alcohol dehydrogenase